jgi:hypothetical protein
VKKNYDIKEIFTMIASLTGTGLSGVNDMLSDIGLPDIDQGNFVRSYKECNTHLKNLRDGIITIGEFQDDMKLLIEMPCQLSFLEKIH